MEYAMAVTCFLANNGDLLPDSDGPDDVCDPALIYWPHVGFDAREVDVLAEMMAVTKISAPPNLIRTALYHYALWLKIEQLHHDDFQLRKGTL